MKTKLNLEKVNSLYRQIVNAAQVYSKDAGDFLIGEFQDVEDDPDNTVMQFTRMEDSDFTLDITEQGLNDATIKGQNLMVPDKAGKLAVLRLYALSPISIKKEWK